MQQATGDEGICVFPRCAEAETQHVGLPICDRHIAKVYRLATMLINDAIPQAAVVNESSRMPKMDTRGAIYFIRLGSLVKIGFTTNLAQRLKHVPHEEVLAVTTGSMRDEKALHAQFAHLRQYGEWFRQGPDLLGHIESLASAA
jgi:hypothetical protein